MARNQGTQPSGGCVLNHHHSAGFELVEHLRIAIAAMPFTSRFFALNAARDEAHPWDRPELATALDRRIERMRRVGLNVEGRVA